MDSKYKYRCECTIDALRTHLRSDHSDYIQRWSRHSHSFSSANMKVSWATLKEFLFSSKKLFTGHLRYLHPQPENQSAAGLRRLVSPTPELTCLSFKLEYSEKTIVSSTGNEALIFVPGDTF